MEENKKDRNLRSAIIRVSAKNEIHTDNKALGLKVGDVVEYSLQDILFTLDDWCMKLNRRRAELSSGLCAVLP